MASTGSSTGAVTPIQNLKSKNNTSSTIATQLLAEPSDYSIHKAWGGKRNFMHSYGLKEWDIDDQAEADAITQAFKDADRENSNLRAYQINS